MPALSKKDPRYYVKQVPLPITPHTGIKIQARSDKVFNPTIPERDEIRKLNYKRRQEQMTSQGFQCASHRPYKGIGDPFYLDHKKLILHALGQLHETEQADSSSSSESDDEEERTRQLQKQLQQKQFTTTNFFVRRTRKDLNTIPKKHQQGKELIRNVKLGHGLFYMLRRERQQKVEVEQREIRKRQEALRNECQPPKRDSDSDAQTDDDIEDDDVELNDFMTTSAIFDDVTEKETFLTETKPDDIAEQSVGGDASLPAESVKASRVAFQGSSTPHSAWVDDTHENSRIKSAKSTTQTVVSSTKGSRRKGPPTRPYTPQHANIKNENDAQIDKNALFRQLCALCWLLEAMNTDNPHIMAPISQCWSMREIGGSRGKDRKQEKEKLDSTWRQFVAKQHTLKTEETTTLLKVAGRRGTSRLNKGGRRYPNYGYKTAHRGSVTGASQGQISVSDTPTGSASVLNDSINLSTAAAHAPSAPNIRVSSAIPENNDSAQDTDDPDDNSKGFFRFLDEYYDSMRSKESSGVDTHATPDDRQSNADGISVYSTRSEKRASECGASRKTRLQGTAVSPEYQTIPEYKDLTPQEIANILEQIERSFVDPRLHKLANPTERRASKTLRADVNVRPKSSPAVLEFKASLPSNKKGSLPAESRQQFLEVYQKKALILHDTLEALEREKFRKIQNKFIHLPTRGSSFHRAVIHMRSRSVAEEENLRESQRRQSLYQQWFTDLESNIPDHLKQDWYLNKILLRLQLYGVNETQTDGVNMMKQVEANKQSAFKFLMVLEGLRDWEVCAPDISAAIEFCREKIVEMSVEEYEDWFHQQFPKVIRPQTAPAACKREDRQKREAASEARIRDRRKKVPMSAPPGVRRAIASAVARS